MEKLYYPYEPDGKFGINFEEIFQLYRSGEKKGVVFGGSGRKLLYEIGKNFLKISDCDFAEFRILSSRVKDSTATFNLMTKLSKLDGEQKFPWKRHPDFFAAEFVGIALKHFENEGIAVNACCGVWTSLSNNCAIYQEELRQSRDKAEAAKKTWSGQIFIKYGFTEVGSINRDEKLGLIRAHFHKPTQ